jgi:hypothetical protein
MEENDDFQRMHEKVKENEKKANKLKGQIETEIEYSATVGSLFSKAFQIDYKTDPGNCLCPEGKVCSSSKGSDITCDFWNCKLFGVKVAEAEETSTVGKSAVLKESKQQ